MDVDPDAEVILSAISKAKAHVEHLRENRPASLTGSRSDRIGQFVTILRRELIQSLGERYDSFAEAWQLKDWLFKPGVWYDPGVMKKACIYDNKQSLSRLVLAVYLRSSSQDRRDRLPFYLPDATSDPHGIDQNPEIYGLHQVANHAEALVRSAEGINSQASVVARQIISTFQE